MKENKNPLKSAYSLDLRVCFHGRGRKNRTLNTRFWSSSLFIIQVSIHLYLQRFSFKFIAFFIANSIETTSTWSPTFLFIPTTPNCVCRLGSAALFGPLLQVDMAWLVGYVFQPLLLSKRFDDKEDVWYSPHSFWTLSLNIMVNYIR